MDGLRRRQCDDKLREPGRAAAGASVHDAHRHLATLGSPFNLHFGGQAAIVGEDLSLTFAQLLGDDRCPQGVECIRAGEADVVIRVADSQHPPADLTLSTVDIPASHGSYHGFDVQLVQVTPYPEAGHAPTPEADTCVQLIVSRQR